MSNIPGLHLENIVLISLSYFLILLINRRTRSGSAILFLLILTFHHIIAYLYAFHLSRPPNEVDPAGFMRLAESCSTLGECGYLGHHLYANYLSKMLAIGHSIYFVFLLNVLFFVISIYFFIGISEIVCLKDNRRLSILIYSMWPSVIYFTTLNYREPFELYLLVAGVYFGLKGSKLDSFSMLLASMLLLLLMGLFHINGLLYLAPIVFVILASYYSPLTIKSLGKKLLLFLIMSLAIYFTLNNPMNFVDEVLSKNTKQLEENKHSGESGKHAKKEKESLTGDSLIYAQHQNEYLKEHPRPISNTNYIDIFIWKVTYYRASISWGKPPQTAFLSNISDTSITAFIATYFLVYLQYLFAPFFFQVNSFLSLVAYGESVLRLVLFLSMLFLIKRNPQVRVLFILYLAITAMWSLGVISYGAAIRHHIQSNWILVLLGIPVISEVIRKRLYCKKNNTDTIAQ